MSQHPLTSCPAHWLSEEDLLAPKGIFNLVFNNSGFYFYFFILFYFCSSVFK